jgi:hypothetical protein
MRVEPITAVATPIPSGTVTPPPLAALYSTNISGVVAENTLAFCTVVYLNVHANTAADSSSITVLAMFNNMRAAKHDSSLSMHASAL